MHIEYEKLNAVEFVEILENIAPVFLICGLQIAADGISDSIDSIAERALEQRFPADSELRVEADENDDAQCD